MTTITTIDDREVTLGEAQGIVGGWVEILQLDEDTQMLIDEEGKLQGADLNEEATAMIAGTRWDGDTIAGDVLILKGDSQWV
jgi:hypothetical protein